MDIKLSFNIHPSADSRLKFARVKTCYQLNGWSKISLKERDERISYKPGLKAGLPDVEQYEGINQIQNNPVILTEHIQTIWYNECVKLAPNHLTSWYGDQFEGLTAGDRALTNFQGSDTNHVYPTGKNSDEEDMKMDTVLTAGAILEIVGSEKIFGRPPEQRVMTPFRCIDALQPLDNFTPDKAPYCWYQPRNSVRDPLFEWNNNHTAKIFKGNYNEDISEVFHWFENKAIAPILINGSNVGWIPTEVLEFM